MRCLYCGKQLPLLKKLTGGGEFCSEAHRQKYQEEYNKLALSRLLQTQNPDVDAPHRGELVLASRTHPALLAGRTPLRALEAPKTPDTSHVDPRLLNRRIGDVPPPDNWAPGVNRTQRALPPPMNPEVKPQLGGLNNDPPKPVSEQTFPAPVDRKPLPAFQPVQEPPRADAFRSDTKQNEKKGFSSKRDAFSFRPTDTFQAEMAKPAPPPPVDPPPAPVPAPVASAPPPPPPIAVKAVKPAQLAEPPEASFLLEEVRKADPPAVPKLEAADYEAFTDGQPPGQDGWARWEPDIVWEPGALERTNLLPLPGPPGTTAAGGEMVRAVDEKADEENKETRKKILENQVKPGDFKQTVPKAPEGLTTVLPICPPAAALERLVATAKAKPPAANPTLYFALAPAGVDLWNGWTVTGLGPIRASLTLVAPEVSEPQTVEAQEAAVSPAPVDAAKAAPAPSAAVPSAPKTQAPVLPVKPTVEPSRNYRAAEALKSAALAAANVSVSKAENLQSDKPATVRHEVFVDLSVLGIEEDEDAEAEYLAGEGESPPGDRPRRVRRTVAAREPVRDLISLGRQMAAPAEPKLAQSFQAMAWKNGSPLSLRLATAPLRPKVVFEHKPAEISVSSPVEERKTQAPGVSEPQASKQSSLASAWSAKRLKKNESGVPQSAPGNSGLRTLVETQVSEPSKTAAIAPEPVLAAKIEQSAPQKEKVEAISESPRVAPSALQSALQKDAKVPSAFLTMPVQGKVEARASESPEPKKSPESRKGSGVIESSKPVASPVETNLLAKADAKLSLEVEAKSQIKSEAKTEPKTEAAAQTKAEPKAEPKTDASTQTKAEPKTQAKVQTKAEAKSQAKAEAKAQSKKGEAKTEAKNEKKQTINGSKLPKSEPLPENPPFEAPPLGLGNGKNGSFWANLPVLPKIAIAIGLIGAIASGVWVTVKPASSTAAHRAPKTQKGLRVGPSLMMNLPGGWSPDWGGEFNRKKNRTISFYRPSASNDDYRIEFEGQVDAKALGWVYRAADPRNYYAYKVEFVRTASDTTVALTHFSVVNGVESQKHFSPLAKPLRTGRPFRVRLDARGDEFSAYINDELIEVWQDDKLPKGGFGVMTELGETAQIRKMQVFELLP